MNTPHRHFVIRKGLDLDLPGAPEPCVETGAAPQRVGLLADDFPASRPRLVVREGDPVRLGQPLFVDRRRPALHFTAPAAGSVARVAVDAQHRLRAIEIAVHGDERHPLPLVDPGRIATAAREDVETLLLASGLWTTLRARPFGTIPAPGSMPDALFVTAIDTHPLAPPPAVVLAGRDEEFTLGLAALARLTCGPVFVCQGAGPQLPRPDEPRVRIAHFEGPHPAGLPGTHIHLLRPVSATRTVWHVDYQEVLALGHLLATGSLSAQRVVALAGPCVARPRLLRTRPGAALDQLLQGELVGGEVVDWHRVRVISGSVLAGRAVTADDAFLGARHRQVTVLPADPQPWLPARGGRPRPFVPVPGHDRVLPLDIPVVPLLRALLLEDDELAVELGVLELDEDDLALLGFVCPSGQDYGTLLRATLSRLQAA